MKFIAHFDLHETTDTDASEFTPAKAARDGAVYKPEEIPDGFYLVADCLNPQALWHRAMIEAVQKVSNRLC